MPPVYDHLCVCVKCATSDPTGLLVSAQTYQIHQMKRPFEPGLEEGGFARSVALVQPPAAGSHIPPQSTISTALPPTQQPSSPPSLIGARLELQQIRYKHLARPFTRPAKLVFAGRPKNPILPNAGDRCYVYNGIFNSTPYDLVECPTNALFLRQEAQMHEWLQQVRHLKEIHPNSNYQLSAQSLEKELTSSLNRMFRWKVEIYFEQHVGPGQDVVSPRLTIDTTRYLQIYDYDGGDPLYSRLVLPGILLVLVLHLLFNGSRSLCEVVLALLHDQLDGLQGVVTDQRLHHLSRILPNTIKGVLGVFEFDPVVRCFVVCSKCYAIVPSSEDIPARCQHQETPASPPCNGKLTRTNCATTGEQTSRPIKEYLHQDFREWLGRFLCHPDIEDMLDSRKSTFQQPKNPNPRVHDILESKGIQQFSWPDGKSFYDCPNNEFRLFFALSGDGFNPFFNKEAKQTATSTGLYLFCLNLPLEERQKPENVYLAGVIPGPDKPSGTQINHYISLIVDDFLPFWNTRVQYTHTRKRPAGALCRAAIVPVLADALGVRQICGDVENFTKSSWPNRDLESHRFWAERWQEAETSVGREKLIEDHGIRYTPLLCLPYFDPPKYSVVDTMHNLLTGLLQRHCRNIWGMDLDMEDGDGEFPPGTTPPPLPSDHAMRDTRRALELGDIAALTKGRKEPLWYLCLDLGLRRGGKKRDFIRELLRWRKAQGPFITDPRWAATDVVEDTTSTPDPLSRTYSSIIPVVPPRSWTQPGGSLAYPGTPTPLTSSVMNGIFQPHPYSTAPAPVLVRMELPSEVSAEKLDAGEDLLSRGLKLAGLTNDILITLCLRRDILLPEKPKKKDLVAALDTWRNIHGVSVKAKKKARPNTVVLGNVILKTVTDDMQKTMVPRWINPAPIRAGQKKHGKLSADQWRVFCSIHLTVALIRLWGRQPEDSRWYQMLTNFLALVKAVEIGSMLVTSKDHIDEYQTLMTNYLVTMKSLYKEARVVPNHHLALHTPDFLQYWGPSSETRGFGWERYNHTLQQMNTNRRFGDIEKSYMTTSSRRANLLSLLSLDYIRERVSKMYQRLQGIIHPEASGTRLNDLLHPVAPTSVNVVRGQARQNAGLSSEEVVSLAVLLDSEQEHPHTSLNPSSTTIHSFKLRGITYRPFSRSPRDSNVLIRGDNHDQPAQLEKIFLHCREAPGEGSKEEVFCKVRYLKGLLPTFVEEDWFRQFGSVGGSLWSTQYEEDFSIIRPESIVCHFARTRLEEVDTGFGFPTFHVLPLDRLKKVLSEAELR